MAAGVSGVLLLLAMPAAALVLNSQSGPAVSELVENRAGPPAESAPHGLCQMTPSKPCSIGRMAAGTAHMVFPDPKVSHARCLDGSGFGFLVVPRNPSKLLLFFEGGGACWDEFSTKVVCGCSPWRVAMGTVLATSVFDGGSTDNPYNDYSIVLVKACSGDLHSGNVARPYTDDHGVPFEQRGYYNTRSAVDWVKANLGSQPLQSLVLMGESAGGIAVQVWAETLLGELSYNQAAVVVDSYVGVFPAGFQGMIFKGLGVCETGLLSEAKLQAACQNGEANIPDVFDAAIAKFPNVTFAMLNSKFDSSQQTYAKMAALSMHAPADANDAAYEREMLGIMKQHNRFPNFVTYLVSSREHVFTRGLLPFFRMDNATAWEHITAHVDKKIPDVLMQAVVDNYLRTNNGVLDWLTKLPVPPGRSIQSVCELLDRAHMPGITHGFPLDADSCEPELSTKVFSQ